jgi:hypothetical protein
MAIRIAACHFRIECPTKVHCARFAGLPTGNSLRRGTTASDTGIAVRASSLSRTGLTPSLVRCQVLPLPALRDLPGDHPPRGNEVRAPPALAAQRRGPPRACLEDRQRLPATLAGHRRHLGDKARRNGRHLNCCLGKVTHGAQTDPARYRCHRQQDRTHCLGHAGASRELPILSIDLNLSKRRQPSAATPECKGRRK